jgi:hypothetical protein
MKRTKLTFTKHEFRMLDVPELTRIRGGGGEMVLKGEMLLHGEMVLRGSK